MRTKNGLLLAVALLAAAPAWAEWEEVTRAHDGTVRYADFSTARINGNLRRIWTLSAYAQPSSSGDLSHKALEEFDCQEGRGRFLQFISFKGSMGSGGVGTMKSLQTPWNYPAPRSSSGWVMKLLCEADPQDLQ